MSRDAPPTTSTNPHVVVVGGGIAGLAAAWSLRHDHGITRVTVLERAPAVGGKLVLADLAGLRVDTGAEAMLARRPEAVDLAKAAGLGDDLEDPETTTSSILVDGVLRRMPKATVMGVPTDLSELARTQVLDAAALARIPLDHVLPQRDIGNDVSVGEYVSQRLGAQVVDRLVAPLLGGVYAGDPYKLSMRATMPALFQAAVQERSLLAAARSVRESAPVDAGPVFAGIIGGVGRLPLVLATELVAAGVDVRTGITVRALERSTAGWRLVLGSAADPELLEADAVVLAVPAAAASRLLDGIALGASVQLDEIPYASVATVSFAYRATDLTGPDLVDPATSTGLGLAPGSGFLVPPDEPRQIKAATYSSQKWGWLGRQAAVDGLTVLRTSLGRIGDVEVLQRDDAELAELAARELAFVLRTGRARPVDAVVTRWGGSLPQYDVGHVDRVAAIRESVATVPGLAVCGAAYDGVGIAACIGSARRAATDVLAGLAVGPAADQPA